MENAVHLREQAELYLEIAAQITDAKAAAALRNTAAQFLARAQEIEPKKE
jgi:hypothetical protein